MTKARNTISQPRRGVWQVNEKYSTKGETLASQGTRDTLAEEGHWGAEGGFLEEAVPLAGGQEWRSTVKGSLDFHCWGVTWWVPKDRTGSWGMEI